MEATSEIQPFCEEDGNRCMHIYVHVRTCTYVYTYTVCVLVCDITQAKVHTN